jgi:hypothetical protein
LKIQKTYKNTICTKWFLLHFEVQDLKSYFTKHKPKAHTWVLSINLVYSVRNSLCWLWVNYQKTIFGTTKFILSAHTNNEGVLIHFNDFSSINLELAQRFSLSVLTKLTTLHHGSRHCGQSHQQPSTIYSRRNEHTETSQKSNFSC